jgi:hypothetical protein
VTHLSSVQDRHTLFVEPLWFDQSWLISEVSMTSEQLITLQKEYKVEHLPLSKQLRLTKRVAGHIILTNYDPQLLSNDERIKLNDEADNGASNDVMVDIRGDYPGGELPLHGFFRLRSFYNVLNFIGRDLDDEPELAIDKHPATPSVRENPVHTLAISVSKTEPDDSKLSVYYEGFYYAVQAESGYQWNREGFRLLHQIFQMTMADLAQKGAPQITISK